MRIARHRPPKVNDTATMSIDDIDSVGDHFMVGLRATANLDERDQSTARPVPSSMRQRSR
jgi:hypothetical protein